MTHDMITAAADRFRAWTKDETSVNVLSGVCDGSFAAENRLIEAFIEALPTRVVVTDEMVEQGWLASTSESVTRDEVRAILTAAVAFREEGPSGS